MKKITSLPQIKLFFLVLLITHLSSAQSIATYDISFTSIWNATDHTSVPGGAHWCLSSYSSNSYSSHYYDFCSACLLFIIAIILLACHSINTIGALSSQLFFLFLLWLLEWFFLFICYCSLSFLLLVLMAPHSSSPHGSYLWR